MVRGGRGGRAHEESEGLLDTALKSIIHILYTKKEKEWWEMSKAYRVRAGRGTHRDSEA